MEEVYSPDGTESTAENRDYPFPFTPAILERFDDGESAPVWRRLAKEWHPESGIPLHLECLKELTVMGRTILEMILQNRVPEVQDEHAQLAMQMFGDIMRHILDELETVTSLGLMTCPVDPVISQAVKSDGNGNGKLPAPMDVEAYNASLNEILEKIQFRRSFRGLPSKETREEVEACLQVDDWNREAKYLEDFYTFTLQLDGPQFPLVFTALNHWLNEYEGFPSYIKSLVMRNPEGLKNEAEFLLDVLTEAFKKMQQIFILGGSFKNTFIDFRYLKSNPPADTPACTVSETSPAAA